MDKIVWNFILIGLFFMLCNTSVYSQADDIEISSQLKYQSIALWTTGPYSDVDTTSYNESAFPLAKDSKRSGKNWDWIIYVLIVLIVLSIIRRYELSKIRMKNQMRIVRIESEKYKDINALKSRFYANISHEFRTPLTLIKGPLEQLIEENSDPVKNKVYRMMYNNTSRLLRLINQLLDLAKIESGGYSLLAQKGDVVAFIEGLALSFTAIAEQRAITLEINVSPELQDCETRSSFYYDPDILDKIINNLTFNALKFTKKNGKVTTSMRIIEKNQKIKFLEISIEDTGIGIDGNILPFIFDRFFQIDHSHKSEYPGTGVGLSIVHELINLHKGEIDVESTPGKGTIFRVRLPAGKDHFSSHEVAEKGSLVMTVPPPLKPAIPTAAIDPAAELTNDNIDHPWVLVVEDQKEVRRYIVESLQNDYRTLQAANVNDGYNLAQEFIPDLIISDIMMPGGDGFELCEEIKNSEKTSHIPIIILTAKVDIHDRLSGLKGGADDYLTKPFNAEELRIRIGNLIKTRNTLREKFSSNSIIKPGEISVSAHDAKFIELLLGLVEENINNIYYSIEMFGSDAGLSQSQLNRKLKAIINMSATQFIRSVRMHRAMELLKKNAGNIAEIAYMVGYDDPGYFSKSFRKFFDKLPSEISSK